MQTSVHPTLLLLPSKATTKDIHSPDHKYSCCCSVASRSNALRPHGLQHTRLLCPWDFPGKNTGVGWHFLLQGILLTQGKNLHLLHWQAGSLPLSHQGSRKPNITRAQSNTTGLCHSLLVGQIPIPATNNVAIHLRVFQVASFKGIDLSLQVCQCFLR